MSGSPTTAQTIALQCPVCSTELELDIGFAGGVCRCFSCGTLMTVPADPMHERAEALRRPERPDAPVQMGALGAESPAAAPMREPSAASPSPRRPARPDQPGAARPEGPLAGRGQQPAPAAPPRSDAASPSPSPAGTVAPVPPRGVETFVTASGRTVRVNLGSISTARARRRAVIRATTVLVFLLCVGVILAVCVAAAVIMLGDTGQKAVVDPTRGVGFVAANNPLKNGKGFLGVPVSGACVLSIDASATSGDWFRHLQAALALSLPGISADTVLQTLYWTDLGPRTFPEVPRKLKPADREQLLKLASGVIPMGMSDAGPMLELALKSKPDQVIVVSSQAFTKTELEGFEKRRSASPGTRIDVILIGSHAEAVSAFARSTGGQYISLPPTQLEAWVSEAKPK